MQISHGGQKYDFPDGTSLEDINDFLGSSGSSSKGYDPQGIGSSPKEYRGDNILKNIAAGLLRGGQNVGRALPDFSSAMPSSMQGAFGNPGQQMNPNQTMGIQPGMELPGVQGAGQMLPAAMAPELSPELFGGRAALGANIPRGEQLAQMLARKLPMPALYGASQRPDAPATGAAEMAAFPAAESAASFSPEIEQLAGQAAKKVGQVGAKMGQAGGRVADTFRPAKYGQELLDYFTGGAKTAEENMNNLISDIMNAGKKQESDALAKRAPVDAALGDKNILATPIDKLPEGNLEKVAKTLDPGDDYFSPEERDGLIQSLSKFRKDGDFNGFMERADDIFNPEKEITPKAESKVEDMLHVATERPSTYLGRQRKDGSYANDDFNSQLHNTREMRAAHNDYKNNPTFESADKIEKKLNNEIAEFGRTKAQRKLTNDEVDRLDSLSLAKTRIAADKNKLLNKYPEHKKAYNEFKDDWKNKVRPYHENADIYSMVTGNAGNMTPTDIGRISRDYLRTNKGKKILQDITHLGRYKILANELLRKGVDPANLDKEIYKLLNTDAMRAYRPINIDHMLKPMHAMRIRKEVAGALGVGAAGLINPVLGVGAGAVKYGVPALKYIAKYMKGI